MGFSGRDFTDIHCVTRDELFYVLDQASVMKRALKARDVCAYRLADGKDLIAALLFYENSTRTRTSFEIAAMRLGLRTTGFAGTEGTSVLKGESLRHTLDMYEAYDCDAVIMRHPLDGSARFAADHLGVPVFNGGDGKHEHPTQTILDLFTIREHLGRLSDFDIGIGGDLRFGRTAHSLALALSKFDGVRLHLFSHPSLALPESLVTLLKSAGMKVTVYENLADMAPKVDILYQTRLQKERMPDLSEFDRAKAISEFTLEMMETTRPRFGLMHPLPIDKAAPSISARVDGHAKALYKEQAGNGVPTRLVELAVSLGLLGGDFSGEAWARPVGDERFVEELPVVVKPARTDVSIRPIRDGGVVIDHIQPYMEEAIVRVLRVRERKDIYRLGTVKSVRRPGKIKGIVMIEDRELSDAELAVVAAVSPGCRVNIIRGGQVARKMELRLPWRIAGIPGMACPNKGCITRDEHRESVLPVMIRMGANVVRCHYCDQIVHSAKVF
ncbi:MAG: aspartate carbamoyltransferase [Deltaproteobacteria bacterium]|nr:aspartate carbamoyltransferase [Deltaproteobacteria bacterium]